MSHVLHRHHHHYHIHTQKILQILAKLLFYLEVFCFFNRMTPYDNPLFFIIVTDFLFINKYPFFHYIYFQFIAFSQFIFIASYSSTILCHISIYFPLFPLNWQHYLTNVLIKYFYIQIGLMRLRRHSGTTLQH